MLVIIVLCTQDDVIQALDGEDLENNRNKRPCQTADDLAKDVTAANKASVSSVYHELMHKGRGKGKKQHGSHLA